VSEENTRTEVLVEALQAAFGEAPEVAIVAGSGWAVAAEDLLEDVRVRPVAAFPGWPVPQVAGHAGSLRVGMLAGRRVAVSGGRVHAYEGRSAAEIVRGVRAMVQWGAPAVLLLNAAGALDPQRAVGAVMPFSDHLNLGLPNPLAGVGEPDAAPRFLSLVDLYDAAWREALLARAAADGRPLQPGVYAGLRGPSYETPAEVRMLRGFGADAVGMSTIPEAIAARAAGARVMALSLLTNLAAGLEDSDPDHHEVLEAGRRHRQEAMRGLEMAVATAIAH
jgi:purine-nucleoside phosphorylase